MVLRVPQDNGHEYTDYKDAIDNINQHLLYIQENHEPQLNWSIYGSFLHNRLRPGLSDIYVYLLHDSDRDDFPLDIVSSCLDIKTSLEDIWIPIKMHHTTTWQLSENYFSYSDYAMEIVRWIQSPYCSQDFKVLFSHIENMQKSNKDMMNAYVEDIKTLLAFLPKTKELSSIPKNKINPQEQGELVEIWSIFRKMISICALAIELDDTIHIDESAFSKPYRWVIQCFASEFDPHCTENLIQYYLRTIIGIRNMDDWYRFLSNWWVRKIEKLYEKVFIPFLNAIDNKFTIK